MATAPSDTGDLQIVVAAEVAPNTGRLLDQRGVRIAFAITIPFVALAMQWLFWDYFSPYVWFLFFPAAFFSAWVGGLVGGLIATMISALLVWYFFMPPTFTFGLQDLSADFSMVVFVFMGGLFSFFHERLRHSMRRTDEALASSKAANLQITRLYEKTLELDTLKNQFFANVSHELRTPLTLILAPLERRLRENAGTGPHAEAARHETEIMLRNARLLYRHVSDLLDVAKSDAGRMVLAWSRLDLARLIRVMASHFESVATERHIAYTVTVPEALLAEADGEKLQRVLLNLLSNAFKFTPDGGAIAVRLSSADNRALIEVRDNGPGIPAEWRDAVFERFRQVEGDARRRHGGTGLGLAIVKDFVELHDGSVALGEAPGGGSIFSVHLPLAAPAGTVLGLPKTLDEVIERQTIEEQVLRSEAQPLAGTDLPLVLVVEDNVDMNEFIASTLRPHYRVLSAFDGAEGLAQALASKPDLILSDLMMPVMRGDEMVGELRRQAATGDIPVIMLTARADEETRLRLLQAGVQDCLNKPFSVDELLARVDGLVRSRRRTLEELALSEQRFRATFEQAAVGIALLAPDGRWLKTNQRLCDIVGYPHEELLTRTFQDITHPDDLDVDLGYVRQMLAGEIETYTIEKRYLRKGGEIVWVNLTVALVRHADGRPDYFISVVEDIQQRKTVEAALQSSEAILKEAQHLAGIGNWRWELQTDRKYWSPEIYRFFGRDPGLPPAPYQEMPAYFAPESWAALSAVVEAGIAEGVPYELDVEIVRTDGTRRWVTARGEAMQDGDGRALELHGTMQDITERKLAEQEIRDLNTSLEQRVALRTEELTAANKDLDSFAYAVSHDLRAPLRAMSGFSQALREDFGDKIEGEGKVYLDQIGIAAGKMTELIDGILALSRSTRGELRRDRVDLSAMATGILAELESGDSGRHLSADIESGLVACCDARMIEAVMRNLLENAWKYTAKVGAPQIRVYAGEVDGQRGICVADNGAGFDMVHADQLFQPFRRLHRQDEFPGIGIGLATVQRIVHRHGGEICAQAAPGQGATFCFTLDGERESL